MVIEDGLTVSGKSLQYLETVNTTESHYSAGVFINMTTLRERDILDDARKLALDGIDKGLFWQDT
jgi:hypothetical protein